LENIDDSMRFNPEFDSNETDAKNVHDLKHEGGRTEDEESSHSRKAVDCCRMPSHRIILLTKVPH
jgi:hypothetical protein